MQDMTLIRHHNAADFELNARSFMKGLSASGYLQDGFSFWDVFGAPGNGSLYGNAQQDIEQLRGWNAAGVMANGFQAVMSTTYVFCSPEEFERVANRTGEESVSASRVTGIEHHQVPSDWVQAPISHPVAKLMKEPNPWEDEAIFKLRLSQQIETHGVAYVLVLPNDAGLPHWAFVVPKHGIRAEMASIEHPEGTYRTGQLSRLSTWVPNKQDDTPDTLQEALAWISNRQFSARYVIPIGIPSLLYMDDFFNPTAAMADVLDTDSEMHRSRRNTLRRQASKGPKIEPKDGVDLQPDEWNQILETFTVESLGSHNAGRPVRVPRNVNITDDSHNAREMEFTASTQQIRDDILGLRGVPLGFFGYGNQGGYAGIVAQVNGYAVLRSQPMQRVISGQLTLGFRRFFKDRQSKQFVVVMQAARLDDPAQKLQELQVDIAALGPHMKVIDYCKMRNIEPFGDERDDLPLQAQAPPGGMPPGMEGLLGGGKGPQPAGDQPNVGAALQGIEAKPGQSAIQPTEFQNAAAGIEETVKAYTDGKLKRAVAAALFNRLGVPVEIAEAMLKEIDTGKEKEQAEYNKAEQTKAMQQQIVAKGYFDDLFRDMRADSVEIVKPAAIEYRKEVEVVPVVGDADSEFRKTLDRLMNRPFDSGWRRRRNSFGKALKKGTPEWARNRLDKLKGKDRNTIQRVIREVHGNMTWDDRQQILAEYGVRSFSEIGDMMASGSNCGTGAGGFKPGNTCAAKPNRGSSAGKAIAAFVRQRKAANPSVSVSFEAIRKEVPEAASLSVGQFQDTMRQLNSTGVITLEPWTRAMSDMPDTEGIAVVVGREPKFYADPGNKRDVSDFDFDAVNVEDVRRTLRAKEESIADIQQRLGNPSIGVIHDALRAMQSAGEIEFLPYTGPLWNLDNDTTSIVHGSTISDRVRVNSFVKSIDNCGTGAGGFQPGNTCARSSSESGLESMLSRHKPKFEKLSILEGKAIIELNLMVVPKESRGKGIASDLLNELTEYADSVGKTIALTPSSDFGGSVPKLKKLYKRFGFIENKGRNKDFEISHSMIRTPSNQMDHVRKSVAGKTEVFTKSTVDTAARQAATSPSNRFPQSSESQKKAGNYRKGRCKISGLKISVENPAGSIRSGTDADGKEWSVKMKSHYGYILGTVGFDKDHFDVFIKPGTKMIYTGPVFVVSQANADGTFDEHKAVIGVDTEEQARAEYLKNFDSGWESRILSIQEMPWAAFRAWVMDGSQNGPKGGDVFTKSAKGDCRWVTLDNGVHVCIDGFGNYAKGPKALTDKNPKPKDAPVKKERQTAIQGLRAQQIQDVKEAVQYAKDVLTFTLRDDDLIVEAVKRQRDSGKAVLQDIGFALEYAKDTVTFQPTRGLIQEVVAKYNRGKYAQSQGNDFVEAISEGVIGKLVKILAYPVRAGVDAMTKKSVLTPAALGMLLKSKVAKEEPVEDNPTAEELRERILAKIRQMIRSQEA